VKGVINEKEEVSTKITLISKHEKNFNTADQDIKRILIQLLSFNKNYINLKTYEEF